MIQVLQVDGTRHEIEIDLEDSSIRTLKRKIGAMVQVDDARIRLFYQGKELAGDDEMVLASFGIADGAILHLHIRPEGVNSNSNQQGLLIPSAGGHDLFGDLFKYSRILMFVAMVEFVSENFYSKSYL